MPINKYTAPVRSSIAPPTDNVGVIRGVSGNGVATIPVGEMPLPVVLLGRVGTGRRVEAMASENVDEGVPKIVADSATMLSERESVLVARVFALLEEPCDGEVTVLEDATDCESDVRVGKVSVMLACLMSSALYPRWIFDQHDTELKPKYSSTVETCIVHPGLSSVPSKGREVVLLCSHRKVM